MRRRNRSWGMRSRAAMALALSAMLVSSPAWSQSRGGKAKGKQDAAAGQDAAGGEPGKDAEPKVKVERRGGKKVFRITTTFVIEGRIQKPNAFYVLQRSQINYDWAKLKQDFVPRIVHSVSKSPF